MWTWNSKDYSFTKHCESCISLCVSMHVCCVYKSVRVCMWCAYAYGYITVRVYICVHVSSCVRLRVVAIRTRLGNPNSIAGVLDCARYGPDTLAIWRPAYEMIWRSIPVHAVKTRWRFGSKIASFLVNVCSYIIFLFTIVSKRLYVTRIISYERLIYFIIMITCIIL